ncbi:DEAD/DEAH box helicase [Blastococcus sp. Marseille-P5729]|uniref:DEAD/DEAH box helicase n=1 Tax=Blastococcus sp. Marseille-P5729 TaxID=2086582 RepID=UPI000D1128AA|nr:DEAD/DEAH box helicase [Blastococcus sp. Marseille-P5729]
MARRTSARQPGARGVLPHWIIDITDMDLVTVFGPAAVQRGAAYQRSGAVSGLRSVEHELQATVTGTKRYQSWAWLEDDNDPSSVCGTCSCPVGVDCKHVVAALLEARHRLTSGTPRPVGQERAPRPSWRALLDPVVAASSDPTTAVPLGLLIEEAPDRSRPGSDATRLRIRPVQPGTTRPWVKGPISWSALRYLTSARDHEPRQIEALHGIWNARNAPSWYEPTDWLWLNDFGPAIWRALRYAQDAGLSFVTHAAKPHPVRLLPDSVSVHMDARRDADGALLLRTSVPLPDPAGRVHPLGNPPHGVFASSGDGLLLAELRDPLSGPVGALLEQADEIRVPAADAGAFLAHYYPALLRQATVESTDGSVHFPSYGPARLGLQVHSSGAHRLQLRWCFRYAVDDQVHEVPLIAAAGQPAAVSVVPRDRDAEERLLASLDVLGQVPGLLTPLPGKTRLGVVVEPQLQGWATAVFVRDVLPGLQARDDIDVTVIGELLDYAESVEPPRIEVATRDPAPGASPDWFGLAISVSVDGREVPLTQLLSALAQGDDRLLMDDGTWFSLQRQELQALRELVEEARAIQDRPSESLRVNRYQAGFWEDLAAIATVTDQSERWSRSVGALLAIDELPRPDQPAGITATLRDYQLAGYQWLSFLWDHELGGILADDMGLGKTLQALAALERARADGRLTPDRPALVVAPTSVVATWQREAARFAPDLQVAPITSTSKRSGRTLAEATDGAHLVVTSYALLRIEADQFTARAWHALILDEAQAVKNHQSRGHQVARLVAAPIKLAITGTPLENSLMDLWALLSITAPGLLPCPKRFGELFRKPIEAGQSPDQLDRLRRRIRPLMLRRTKDAVAADLPPKIEQILTVPLNPAHRRVYDTHLQRERQRILGLLADVNRNRVAILTGLTRLRQLALDVHLVDPDLPASIAPSKVDTLIEHIAELAAEGHRCLVFSQFTRFLAVVRDQLALDYVYLDGRTRDRPRRIAQFTEGDAPVFLISLKAGGAGLTLTEADYVFVLDPWWNPAVEAQAVDRTHRIGQDKTVMVYRLVAEDTIEEKVVALQAHKRELFEKVIEDGGLMAAPLTADDIRGLLDA